MNTTFSCQIEEITQCIFATMLNMEMQRVDETESEGSDKLLATIQITGESPCSVVLGLSKGTARASAAAMLQMADADVTDADERDVAAELVNMIGGNLKSLLPSPSYLSLPTVVAGTDVQLQVSGAELVDHVTLECSAGLLRVRRYARTERNR